MSEETIPERTFFGPPWEAVGMTKEEWLAAGRPRTTEEQDDEPV